MRTPADESCSARTSRADRQAGEYAFPYHHLPHVASGRPRLGRNMRGGMEYLAYLGQVVDIVVARQAASVLDVGCGDGRLLAELSGRVDRLVGVDLDARAIAQASALSPGVDFRTQSVEEVEGTFDVVTCVETLEHVPDEAVETFLESTSVRVSPGGRLVITVPSTARPVLDKHYRHYDTASLRAAVEELRGEWTVERLEEIVPHRPWLDRSLRLLSNRSWTIDVAVLNRMMLRRLRSPVGPGARGLHVLAVLRRRS